MESMKEMIEKRAYHLFLKRGGIHGYHMQDWIQAEKEIKAELNAPKKNEAKPSAVPIPRVEPLKEAPAAPVSVAKSNPVPNTAPTKPVNQRPNIKGRKKAR
jgi:hypothetical protein